MLVIFKDSKLLISCDLIEDASEELFLKGNSLWKERF